MITTTTKKRFKLQRDIEVVTEKKLRKNLEKIIQTNKQTKHCIDITFLPKKQ